MGEVNYPLYCMDCCQCVDDGDVMVGDEAGGGPEWSYLCKAGKNMSYYWFNHLECPDFDLGY